MNDGAVVVDLNITFNKAFDTINHEYIKIKLL